MNAPRREPSGTRQSQHVALLSFLLLTALLAACGGSASTPTPSTPTSGVHAVLKRDSRPCVGVTIAVRSRPDGKTVGTATTDQGGACTVSVPPGSYVLVTLVAPTDPSAGPEAVKVRPGRITKVSMDADTNWRTEALDEEDALYTFTFMTSTHEPSGDVVATTGAPEVFPAVIRRVDRRRRVLTFDVVTLYQGEEAYRVAGKPVDNAIVRRNDRVHRQTLRLAPHVRGMMAGGVGAVDALSFMTRADTCWLAVDRGRITMVVVMTHP